MQQMRQGRVRERFEYDRYKAVALEVSQAPTHRSAYHYRMLFFPKKSEKPVLSLNLESSILGSYCLTEQAGGEHRNLGSSEESLSYEDFKKWALGRAKKKLH